MKKEPTREEQITAMVEGFAAIYGRNVNAIAMAWWVKDLAGLTPEQIAQTCERGRGVWKDMPTPSDFLELAGSSRHERARLIWDKVLYAIRHRGKANPPKFSLLIGLAIRRVGGWEALCEAKESDLVAFTGRKFCDALVELKAAEERGTLQLPEAPRLRLVPRQSDEDAA